MGGMPRERPPELRTTKNDAEDGENSGGAQLRSCF